jgi:predicted ATPase
VIDAAGLLDAVSTALGVAAKPGESVTDSVRKHLQHRQMLLVLDNCEHLVTACAQLIDTLIRTNPGVQFLVTSREPLRIHGETVWAVPQLADNEAVALFIQRAQAGGASTFTPGEIDLIGRICGFLEGIPLAIELAAVRVPALGVAQVAELVEDRLGFLSRGSRLDSPRHQTLRTALDWSFALLDSGERCLLARLAVFTGGWGFDAAREVCGWGELTSGALDALVGLVDKSLLLVDTGSGPRRFRFLETIREYAADRLADSDDDEPTRARHASFFLAIAESAAVTRLGIRYPGDMGGVRREHANMRGALRWLLESGRFEEGLGLCQALSGFWLSQGFLHEGEEWMARFVAHPQDVSASALAGGLHAWGRLAEYAGALDRARELFARSNSIGEANDEPALSARARCGMGDLELHHGSYVEAADHFRGALDLAELAGSAPETAQALMCLGRVAHLNGDLERSRMWLERALVVQRQRADPWGVAYVLSHLGQQAYKAGQFERAQALLEECHVLWRQAGTRMGERSAVIDLASVTLGRGAIVRSAELAHESLQLSREIGDDDSTTTVRCLEIAAQSLAALGSTEISVGLVAAATRRREILGAPRPAFEQPEVDDMLAAARVALGAKTFNGAWNRGFEMSIAQSVEVASAGLVDAMETASR